MSEEEKRPKEDDESLKDVKRSFLRRKRNLAVVTAITAIMAIATTVVRKYSVGQLPIHKSN